MVEGALRASSGHVSRFTAPVVTLRRPFRRVVVFPGCELSCSGNEAPRSRRSDETTPSYGASTDSMVRMIEMLSSRGINGLSNRPS